MVKNSRTKYSTFYLFAYWHDSRWKKFVGATVKIWDLAQNLSKQGHNVTLFLPRYHFDIDESSVKVVEIPFLDLPFLRLISFNFFLFFFLLLSLFRIRPDIVYVRRMGSIIPGIYASLVKAIFFYEVNDDPYKKAYHEGSLTAFRLQSYISEKQDEINLKLCRRAFVITKEISEKIQRLNSGLEADKLIIMPSGTNIDLFKPMNRRECRVHLSIQPNKKYIGFAGTLLKHQGIEVLINASHTILKNESSSTFLVVGEGPMKEIWMKEVERQDLKDCFIFAGQVDYEDMPYWIGAMDICVAPFLRTAGLRSPVKIFDYLACGRPVVASNIEGTTDIFAGTGAITLVEPENPQILAGAIIDLLGNKEKAKRMGQKGRSLVVKNYDRQSIAKTVSGEAYSLIKRHSRKD
jgi:glycosyltransferase involved in cell wall biosynthesis